MCSSKTNRSANESGYVLLALMLVLTLMMIAMSVAAPRIAQQIKRQKEEELVHRGMDYAMAVKRFAHKNGGRYPASIEQLEDTNHVRFLRKRYKDPITGEDDWKLVHYGEAQIKIPTTTPGSTLNTTQNPGLSGSTPSTGTAGNSSGFGGGPTFGGPSGGGNTGGLINQGASNTLAGGPQSLGQAPPPPGSNGTLGSLTTSNIGNGQTVGGGQIIGVASVSKGQSIKEFNDKDHYNEWLFVYDQRLEQSGGTGVSVAEPMSASAAGSGKPGAAGQAGNPAGTLSTNPPGPDQQQNGQPLPPGQAPAGGGQTGQPVTPAPTPN